MTGDSCIGHSASSSFFGSNRVVRKIDHASTQATGFPHFWAVLEKLG